MFYTNELALSFTQKMYYRCHVCNENKKCSDDQKELHCVFVDPAGRTERNCGLRTSGVAEKYAGVVNDV